MNRQARQSEYEKKWALAFLKHLNSEQGSDYIIADDISIKDSGWADVDVEMTSPSERFPNLYLQLTRDDRLDTIMEHDGYRTPVFNSDNILEAINDKATKYKTKGKDFSKITLLVQGTLSESSRPFELTEELFSECLKFNFKDIYYISAPSVSNAGGTNHYQDWFVQKLT